MTGPAIPTLAHLTWQSANAGRAVRFLSELFGWRFEPRGDGYFVCSPPSGAWIGVTQVDEIRHGNAFVPHISVPDRDAIVAKVPALGGAVLEAHGRIPGVGRYADLKDPDGTLFTVIEFGSADAD